MSRIHRLTQSLVIGAALFGAGTLGGCKSGDDDDTGMSGSGGSGGAMETGGSGGVSGVSGSGGVSGVSGSGAGGGGAGGASGTGGSGSGGAGAGGSGGSGVGGSGGTGGGGSGGAGDDAGMMMGGPLKLTSASFMDGMMIDAKFRCDGPSPAISWSGGPAETMSFAVVLKDVTDGFSKDFLHWVIYDIPTSTTSLDEDVPEGAMPAKPAGAKQAPNWSGTVGFDGPCGPSGTNTYELTLYAIKVAALPGLTASSSGEAVVTAIQANSAESAKITITSTP